MYEFSRLRKRQSRLSTMRPGLELEHRKKHVRLGLQEPLQRRTQQKRAARGKGHRSDCK